MASLKTILRNATIRLHKRVGLGWRYNHELRETQVYIPNLGASVDPVMAPDTFRDNFKE